ncbi:MAG TPA: MDR family MFS transporter [Acidimicrobiales bacterium]|nr:MDR family MFS transporter [Acidimicrobiales bacterium]
MTTTAAPGELETGYSHRAIQLIMSGLMLGMLLSALDQTIVSTALTTISRDFHRPDLYSWVVTSYLLTSTVTTPLYGKVSDLFGRKRVFQLAIVIFLGGSVLSGLSGSMYQLIAFRGVQGLGAGGLMSLAFSIVGDVIPPRQRGRYQGYFGAVFGASSVLGPLIGGFLVDQASWRWVFYVNLPIGAVALVVINRVLHLDHTPRRAHIDWVGALLLVAGVGLFLVGVQDAGQTSRIDATSAAFGITGLLLSAAFVLWERHDPEPILPLRLFSNRIFTVANSMGFVTGAVMFGAIIFNPQYMQVVRGVSPTMSGLRLLPLLGGLLITSIGSGRLVSSTGRYKHFVIAGTVITTVGFAWMTQLRVDTSLWVFSAMIFVVGAGLGLFMQILVLAVQNAVEMKDMGVATSSVTFFRTLGGAIGAAVLGAVLIQRQNALTSPAFKARHLVDVHAFTSALDRCYEVAIPVSLVAVAMSFLLREVKLRNGPAANVTGEGDVLPVAESAAAANPMAVDGV